jgi:hypothetical protein
MGNDTHLEDIRHGIDAQIKALEAQGVFPRRAPAAGGLSATDSQDGMDHRSVALPTLADESKETAAAPSSAPGAPPPLVAPPLPPPGAPVAAAQAPGAVPAPQAKTAQDVALQQRKIRAKLENRLTFLVDLRQKLDEDPELFNFVDSMIALQVKAPRSANVPIRRW